MANQKMAGWCLVALGLVLLTVSGRLDLFTVVPALCLTLLAVSMLRCAARKKELAR